MDTLLILHQNIPERDVFINALNPNVSWNDYASEEEHYNTLANRRGLGRIAFVWENGSIAPTHLYNNISANKFPVDGKNYTYISNAFANLIKQLGANNPGITIDLLTCNLYEQRLIDELEHLMNSYGVVIRYSLDQTGDEDVGGNWILESDSVDVKAEYFTDAIDDWKNTLLTSGTALHNGYIKNGKAYIYGRIGYHPNYELIPTITPVEVSLTDVSFRQLYLFSTYTSVVSTDGNVYSVTFSGGYGSHTITQDPDISNVAFYYGGFNKFALTTDGKVYVKGQYDLGMTGTYVTANTWTYLDFNGETIVSIDPTPSRGIYAITDTNKLYVADYYAHYFFNNIDTSLAVPQNVLDGVSMINVSSHWGKACVILTVSGDVYTLGSMNPPYKYTFNTLFGQEFGNYYDTKRKLNGSFDPAYKMIDGSGNKVIKISYTYGRALALHEDSTVTIWGDIRSNNITATRIHIPQKLTTTNGGTVDVSGIADMSTIAGHKNLFLTTSGKLFWVGSVIIDYKDLSVVHNGSWYGATMHYDATNDDTTNYTNQKIADGVTTMANTDINMSLVTGSGGGSSGTGSGGSGGGATESSPSTDVSSCSFVFSGDNADVSYCAAGVTYVSLDTFRSMFQFRTSEIVDGSLNSAVFDTSGADIRYDVSYSLFPNFNVMNSMMDASSSEGIMYQSHNPASNLVKHDYMYFLAKKLFGTVNGVAFFKNRGSVISALEGLGDTYLTQLKNSLEEADNSGNGLDNSVSGNVNYTRRFLQQVAHFAPSRLDVSGSDGILDTSGSQAVPFHEGDTVSLFVTINPTANQHMLTNTSEIESRVYRIVMYLTNDSSNTNTISH